MITELFTPYTESLELKKLGFEEECFGYYNHHPPRNNHPRGLIRSKTFQDHNAETEGDDLICSAILYQQAFDFFRKKYNIDKVIGSSYNLRKTYFFRIETSPTNGYQYFQGEFKTYEEARLECLRKLIKICREQ